MQVAKDLNNFVTDKTIPQSEGVKRMYKTALREPAKSLNSYKSQFNQMS